MLSLSIESIAYPTTPYFSCFSIHHLADCWKKSFYFLICPIFAIIFSVTTLSNITSPKSIVTPCIHLIFGISQSQLTFSYYSMASYGNFPSQVFFWHFWGLIFVFVNAFNLSPLVSFRTRTDWNWIGNRMRKMFKFSAFIPEFKTQCFHHIPNKREQRSQCA